MIVAQSEKSKAIMSLICALPDCSHFPPEQDELCRSLSNTIIDPEFPGALIPVVLPNQGIRIIARSDPLGLETIVPCTPSVRWSDSHFVHRSSCATASNGPGRDHPYAVRASDNQLD